MPTQTRDAAIVGIHEYPLRKVELTSLQIKAECAIRALEDAGLTWKDVDAVYETGEGGGVPSGIPSTPHYFGVKALVVVTTMSGGASLESPAARPKPAIPPGQPHPSRPPYGSTMRRDAVALGSGGRSYAQGPPHPVSNMEDFWGLTLVGDYAMVAQRHMHEYGTTSEQPAEISVSTRLPATRNPEAVQRMKDLGFHSTAAVTL